MPLPQVPIWSTPSNTPINLKSIKKRNTCLQKKAGVFVSKSKRVREKPIPIFFI